MNLKMNSRTGINKGLIGRVDNINKKLKARFATDKHKVITLRCLRTDLTWHVPIVWPRERPPVSWFWPHSSKFCFHIWLIQLLLYVVCLIRQLFTLIFKVPTGKNLLGKNETIRLCYWVAVITLGLVQKHTYLRAKVIMQFAHLKWNFSDAWNKLVFSFWDVCAMVSPTCQNIIVIHLSHWSWMPIDTISTAIEFFLFFLK